MRMRALPVNGTPEVRPSGTDDGHRCPIYPVSTHWYYLHKGACLTFEFHCEPSTFKVIVDLSDTHSNRVFRSH